MPSTRFFVLVVLFPLTSYAHDEVKTLISQLGKGQSASDRVAAAKQLVKRDDPDGLQAVDALARNCADSDAKVRGAAVLALGGLLHRYEQPCHLSLVQAMFDEEVLIRTDAGVYVELMAKRLPKEAISRLLAQAAHRDPSVRSNVLQTLAEARGDDPMVRAVLRQAMHDRDCLVSNNAILAWFKRTDDLSVAIPHWLLLLDAPVEQGNRQREGQKLVQIAVANRFRDLGIKRPKEIITVLVPLLKDESATVRGAAARILGAIAEGPDRAKQLLVEMRVRQAVEPLLDDAIESVRGDAAISLNRLPK